SARKVLPRTTIDLARHATYALAIHQIDAAGGAVALNHDRAGEGDPFEGFRMALESWADAASFTGHTTLGLSAEEAGPSLAVPWAAHDDAIVSSAVASAPVSGAKVVIASSDEEASLHAAATAAGAASVDIEPDPGQAMKSGAGVLFVRGKTGAVDHAIAADTNIGHLVGLQPLTTTARALAMASRAGCVIVPDFVSAAGPYLVALDSGADITAATTAAVARFADAGTDGFVRACELAEDHLRTWTSDLPFGRPLAP
ncbi:MAG: hypothetical protein KJP22_01730, partial [Acidimicrobiia bacterium]|nr:hypothetical protein [Acidimicrobiia bacterium]